MRWTRYLSCWASGMSLMKSQNIMPSIVLTSYSWPSATAGALHSRRCLSIPLLPLWQPPWQILLRLNIRHSRDNSPMTGTSTRWRSWRGRSWVGLTAQCTTMTKENTIRTITTMTDSSSVPTDTKTIIGNPFLLICTTVISTIVAIYIHLQILINKSKYW